MCCLFDHLVKSNFLSYILDWICFQIESWKYKFFAVALKSATAKTKKETLWNKLSKFSSKLSEDFSKLSCDWMEDLYIVTRNNIVWKYGNTEKSIATTRSECATRHENKASYNTDYIVPDLIDFFGDDWKVIRTQIARKKKYLYLLKKLYWLKIGYYFPGLSWAL